MATGTENTLNSTRKFRVLATSTAHKALQQAPLKAHSKANCHNQKRQAPNRAIVGRDPKQCRLGEVLESAIDC